MRIGLLATFASIAVKRGLQYRVEFVLEGLLALISTLIQLTPVLVVFSGRNSIVGWSMPEFLILLGWFIVVRAIVDGLVAPSLLAAAEGIRTGRFDYILMRPVDSLFLSSFSELRPWKLVDLTVGATAIMAGIARLSHPPEPTDAIFAALFAAAGVICVYGLYVLCVASAFALVRVYSLVMLLSGLIDFARWPIDVFSGPWRAVFTIILPLAVMTSHPVSALVHRASLGDGVTSITVACGFLYAARAVWAHALASYRSASS